MLGNLKSYLSMPPLPLTDTQIKNLAIVTLYVHEHVKDAAFSMENFRYPGPLRTFGGHDPRRGALACDRVEMVDYPEVITACLCGYGPSAGIPPEPFEKWGAYGMRVFGVEDTAEMGVLSGRVMQMLFDNAHGSNPTHSRTAAVKRAAYLLQNGFPANEPVLRLWEAPADFTPDFELLKRLATGT